MVLLFWKFLIKKIINQGKNIFLFFSKLEEKRKGKFLKISSRIHKYNKNLYIFNPKKKNSNKFSVQYFFSNNFSFPFHNFPNKQTTSTHYTLFCYWQFVCGARDAIHCQRKTPWQCNRDARLQTLAWSLGKKGWMVKHLPLHLCSLHLLLYQGLFVHHLHRVDVTCILKSLY